MMDHSWIVVILALVCLATEINATINPDEPFVALGCDDTVYIAQLGEEPLDFSTSMELSGDRVGGISYNPTDATLYYESDDNIYTNNVDLTDEMILVESAERTSLAVNLGAEKLFTLGSFTPKGGYITDLDGSNEVTVDALSGQTWNGINAIGSIVLAADNYPLPLVKVIDATGALVAEYTLPIGVLNADIDTQAGDVYFLELNSYPIGIYRSKLDDVNATCLEQVVRTDPAVSLFPLDFALYGNYIYVATKFGLTKVEKSGATVTEVATTGLPVPKLGCLAMHLHDPAKIAAQSGFSGSNFNFMSDSSDMDAGNFTTPTNMSIPVAVKQSYFGGMIADLVIPITGPMKDWRLEISFPRQVFQLEIQGCSAEVSRKITREYGRRKGTDYVIVPTEESRTPTPGQDLTITIIGSSFKRVRTMKRGISAEFYPIAVEPPTCHDFSSS